MHGSSQLVVRSFVVLIFNSLLTKVAVGEWVMMVSGKLPTLQQRVRFVIADGLVVWLMDGTDA